MTISQEDIEFSKDLFADLGPITTRKMFGGLSIYCDGVIFAIIGPEDKLFVKAKDDLADELAALGSTQFAFEMKDGKVSRMGYWTLPENALDDPELACDWARKSLTQNT